MSHPSGRARALAVALMVVVLVIGCDAGDSPLASRIAAGSAGQSADEADRCVLLSADEVATAIGAHDGGSAGSLERPNLWGSQSCRWTASASSEITGLPGRWSDAIEVAVFDRSRDAWGRRQAQGESVEGLGNGALYDDSSGELWFECGAGRFCAVKVHTRSAAGREQLARRLAESVRSRIR